MSSWVIAGKLFDFVFDLEDIIESLLSSHWQDGMFDADSFDDVSFDTDTIPAYSDVKFGNDWWDGNTDYQIHILHPISTITEPASNGWRVFEYKTLVAIHVFVRGLKGQGQPAALGNIERNIQRIISQHHKGLGSEHQEVTLTRGPAFKLVSRDSDIWHSLSYVESLYMKQDNSHVAEFNAEEFNGAEFNVG